MYLIAKNGNFVNCKPMTIREKEGEKIDCLILKMLYISAYNESSIFRVILSKPSYLASFALLPFFKLRYCVYCLSSSYIVCFFVPLFPSVPLFNSAIVFTACYCVTVCFFVPLFPIVRLFNSAIVFTACHCVTVCFFVPLFPIVPLFNSAIVFTVCHCVT